MPAHGPISARVAECAVLLVATLGFGIVAPLASPAQTFTVLHMFSCGTDGQNPQGALALDDAGTYTAPHCTAATPLVVMGTDAERSTE
jgi:hypothetical protein